MSDSKRHSMGLAALAMIAAVVLSGAKSTDRHPLEPYLGNTLVCAAAETGNDLCHTWLERDGTFLNFDPSGMHKGHYTVGDKRPDGKVPICYFYDNARMVLPMEAMGVPAPLQPGGRTGGEAATSPPPRRGGVLCDIVRHASVCRRYDSDEGLSDSDRKRLHWSIAERFHNGMCYPLRVDVEPGASWWEDDDPLPGQNGIDKLFLLRGHR